MSPAQAAQEVDVQALERELRELWKGMARPSEGESGTAQAVMRACVLNLVVYAPGAGSAAEVSSIMAEVSARHPSRILVLLAEPQAAEAGTSATVTALCHLSSGRKQVCCEQILIEARGGSVGHLPSLVRPLLVSELPTVLWWRAPLPFDSALLRELIHSSGRVVFDSGLFADPRLDLPRLAALLDATARWTRFTDLSWSALTPWRALLAGLFDAPRQLERLEALERVEIEYGAGPDAPVPVQVLLLAGWLASRLGWKAETDLQVADGGLLRGRFLAGRRPVELELRREGPESGLRAIRLHAGPPPGASFFVARTADAAHLESGIGLGGARLCGKLVRLEAHEEARLLSRELEILQHDTVYEKSVAFFGAPAPEPDQRTRG